MPINRMSPIFPSWDDVLAAPRSEFFHGKTVDWVEARKTNPNLAPSVEPLLTQSNARILIGHACNGSLRFAALPTSVYPAPTQSSEFGLGPGMYHHFDVAMYAGDLAYAIVLETDGQVIDIASDSRENVSCYADFVFPFTQTKEGNLEIALLSVAPVAPEANRASLAPAPLPGPPGMIYVLHLRNSSTQHRKGKVMLQAGDLLVGHYEDARPEMRDLKQPTVDLRQHTLILTRPEGTVGVHLHDGRWTKLDAPFQAERAFELGPGEEAVFETHVVLGQSHSQIMEALYALHLHSALDWVNFTAAFWRSRLGNLKVDASGASEHARLVHELHIRNVLDNFNCLQTDSHGNLIAHWQGAPSHGYGTVWGIDVEPTAVSIVHVCPELSRQVLLFFIDRSHAPKGSPDHSLPILVAPLVIARQWFQVTGDTAFLKANPEVLQSLENIMQHVLALESKSAALFPSRYSSDGVVGRRFDYGTNVKIWYAFESLAYLLRVVGREEDALQYAEKSRQIQADIRRTMIVDGPFGLQISGGTNLDEDPMTFYLSEDALYYDGEDTSSMLAPIYGICDFSDPAWINYHRFARSLWHAGYDPEFDTLYWHPAEPAVFDGTAYFSRLAGGVTPSEMREGLDTLRQIAIDDVTGSVFWWPHGLEYKRSLTRCSQGQGAWAWQFFQQWLGIKIDAPSRTITFAPLGLLTQIDWPDFRSGSNQFGIVWEETKSSSQVALLNANPDPWIVQVGFRQPGSGAMGGLQWQSRTLEAGETGIFTNNLIPVQKLTGLIRAELGALEVKNFGDQEGIIFKRFGPALLWGHWDPDLQWRWDVMPLALRFVLANFSGSGWNEVSVDLECPDGWQAQGRLPMHWTPPNHLDKGLVHLKLGELQAQARTVAAYWIKAPFEFEVVNNWENTRRPFHAPSQPGAGMEIFARRIIKIHEVVFTARLTATAVDGRRIERSLDTPVKIIPYP